MTWRADCPTLDLVCTPSSLFRVGTVFLIEMASFIAHICSSLSNHHIRSLPVYHTVMSVRIVYYCRFVFYACLTFSCLPSLDVMVLTLCVCVCSSCRTQWLRGRVSDARLRGPGFEFFAAMLIHWAHCSLYVAPIHSAV